MSQLRACTRSWSAAALSLIALNVPLSHAFQIKNKQGEPVGSFDTTISVGASWRVQGRDPALVGIANGGTARSTNEDDGNLNFDTGARFSAPIRITHELALKRENVGVFARGTYFHDFDYSEQPVNGVSGFGPRGRDRLGSHGELLDLFAHGSFDVAGRRLSTRVGQQVVSWGESTFIPNGINSINPVNLARLRSPGAELREALLPQPMIWASRELSDSVSVELFYQFKHRRVLLDPRGSYFSTNDFISDDGDRAYLGFGRRPDQHARSSPFTLGGQVSAPRSPDREPSDDGQYGLAFRALLPELNSTELGFYFMNYHSRVPLISGVRGAASISGAPGIPTCGAASTLVNVNVLVGLNPLGQFPCAAGAAPLVAGNYFVEFPEDIRLFGISFNTAGPAGVALQGEYSYRPNQPMQLAATELLLAALGLPNNITGSGTAPARVRPGTEIEGYRRVAMHQAQVTATKAFGPMLRAEQLTALVEIGYTYLSLPRDLLFQGPATYLPAPGSFTALSGGSSQPGGAGYATRGSWGYRIFARMDYPNVFAGGTLSPRVAFAHDVHGVGPSFNQGTKAATLGLSFGLKQRWLADLAYTTFWGGRTFAGSDPVPTAGQPSSFASSANLLKDRDFLSLSLSYSF